MPEITGLDKHLLRRGGPGWPSLSSTVVLVYCFFPPSSIYSSVLLNVLGVGRWWVRRWLDKSSLYGAGWNHFLTHEGIGRKKTHKRAPSCLQTLRCLQGPDLPLCASLCLCYNHMDLLANMIHWDMCEYVCVCPCVPVCLGYRRSFAIDCVFCQISFARTKQRSYDACLASRLHIQFI